MVLKKIIGGIHLTQPTPIYRLWFYQFAIGGWFHLNRLLCQTVEEFSPWKRCAAVEPKDKLVQVVGKIYYQLCQVESNGYPHSIIYITSKYAITKYALSVFYGFVFSGLSSNLHKIFTSGLLTLQKNKNSRLILSRECILYLFKW